MGRSRKGFTLIALLVFIATAAYAQRPETIEAAVKGDVKSQIKLGYGFRDGSYGKKDNQKAFEWFSKAAATTNPEALDNLGWLVENGMGTTANGAKARELYRKAADQKHVLAINNLARCYRDGVGGAVDTKEALKWSVLAFETNPGPETANPLAMALLNEPSLTPYRALIDRLATVMNHKVLKNVARIYHEGSGGTEKNPQRVRELFAAARAHGMPAELLDADQLDDLAKRPRVTGQFAYQPTHHLDQGYNMCAPTSAAMGLEFYLGKPVDPYAIKKNSDGQSQPGTGTAWDCMMHGIKAVSGHDWEFRSWPNNDTGFDAGLPVLLAELDAGRIALIDLGEHTVVLSGYDAEKQVVYINNPAYGWPGIHTVSYADLRKKWHSPWHVTTTKGVEARPVLLTADSAKKSAR